MSIGPLRIDTILRRPIFTFISHKMLDIVYIMYGALCLTVLKAYGRIAQKVR